ncbi:MAG: aminoacyl-tRNA hydrolase [Gammaproteobacteria bacterium]|nr:aminoacyl-tRNA hydrolase [Gammaproteobacteria bacterium]
MSLIQLIAGLGNPGPEYAETRHNAGFWLLDALLQSQGTWTSQSKFFGLTSRCQIGAQTVHVLKPMTFMNKSGQSVLAVAQFYKIPPEAILIVHDELDINPGEIRLKRGGGHGGHNGLRDVQRVLGDSYARIRVGIGHPGHKSQVLNYVLGKPRESERNAIQEGLAATLSWLPEIVRGDWSAAMNALHQRQGESSGI